MMDAGVEITCFYLLITVYGVPDLMSDESCDLASVDGAGYG